MYKHHIRKITLIRVFIKNCITMQISVSTKDKVGFCGSSATMNDNSTPRVMTSCPTRFISKYYLPLSEGGRIVLAE